MVSQRAITHILVDVHRVNCPGLHVCIFTSKLYHMYNIKRTHKMDISNHIILWIMFVLGTFKFAGATNFFQRMWIDKRGTNGGPVEWYTEHFGDPVNTLSSASGPPSIFLQDAVLVSFNHL